MDLHLVQGEWGLGVGGEGTRNTSSRFVLQKQGQAPA